MKKYVMLFAFTAIAAIGITASGQIYQNSVKTVSTVKVNPITVEASVICTGKVERTSCKNVFAPYAGTAGEIFVKAGDKVSVGQELLRMDAIPAVLPPSIPAVGGIAETYAGLLQEYGSSVSSTPQEPTAVVAPVSGEIISVNVMSQGLLDPTKPVAVIASDPSLQVRLSVNEAQIAEISVGQQAVITGVGFRNSSYIGVVKSISNEAKQVVTPGGQETVVEVFVSVSAPGADIKPGYTAKAKIITSQNGATLIAPYEAVHADAQGNEFVYCLKNGRAVKKEIQTGEEYDDGFAVVSGLSAGDEIILGAEDVTNGAAVKTAAKTAEAEK